MIWWVLFSLVIGLGIGFLWGIYVHKYRIFPYDLAKRIFHLVHRCGPWSIGIYEGPHPFQLEPARGVKNPIITRRSVSDLDARYTADLFLVVEEGGFYLFFEAMDRSRNKGVIALAESSEGRNWSYRGVVLNEPFHLSYPHVFKVTDTYFMIPESAESLSVRLYKAAPFPLKWEYVKTLVSGRGYEDPTVFRYKGKWWMLSSLEKGRYLCIHFSEDLAGEWTEHPLSPLGGGNYPLRPGGRMVFHRGRLFRMVQDQCSDYGVQVFVSEITVLTETAYEERLALERPVVAPSGRGWNSRGMHHVDLQKLEDRWIAVVDGRAW